MKAPSRHPEHRLSTQEFRLQPKHPIDPVAEDGTNAAREEGLGKFTLVHRVTQHRDSGRRGLGQHGIRQAIGGAMQTVGLQRLKPLQPIGRGRFVKTGQWQLRCDPPRR